jgi:hypothetical protein
MQNTYFINMEEENMSFENLDFLCDTIENIIYPVGSIWASTGEIMGSDLNIYPSPMTETMTVSVPDQMQGGLQIEIFDIKGRSVRTLSDLRGRSLRVERNDLATGTYLLRLSDSVGQHKTSVFLVGN